MDNGHMKRCTISHQQGNADQNYNEILSPHTCQNGHHLKDMGEQVLVRMPLKKKKKEPSYTTDGNINWFHSMKNNMKVPQKVKSRSTT